MRLPRVRHRSRVLALAATLTLAGHASPDASLANSSTVTIRHPTAAGTASAPGGVVINEFRTEGPSGASDEFIEIQNAGPSDADISDWRFRRSSSTGSTFAINLNTATNNIPAGTVLRPGQSYLVVNSGGYSLSNYGGTGAAAGDASYTSNIANNGGIALLNAKGVIVDQVGMTAVAGGYYEGTPLTPLPSGDTTSNYAYVRRTINGRPQDTDNNAGTLATNSDFILASTDGNVGSLIAVLGAPGPQNMTSPLRSTSVSGGLVPGVRDRVVTSGNFGTLAPNGILTFQRRYANTAAGNMTKLRFRVYDITTLNSPDLRAAYGSTSTRQAVLRVLGRASATVIVDGQTLQGLVLEQPPDQTAQGGGLNSTVTVELPSALAPGASVDVQFRLGIQGGGYYRFFVVFEALP